MIIKSTNQTEVILFNLCYKTFKAMAVKRLKIKTDIDEYVHFDGASGVHLTLCGLETGGDSGLGIETAITTKEKVTCPDCISIVEWCKGIRKTSWEG